MSEGTVSHIATHIFFRYGIHLKVIHTSSDATERLSHLIRQVIFYLRQQQKTVDSGLRILLTTFLGWSKERLLVESQLIKYKHIVTSYSLRHNDNEDTYFCQKLISCNLAALPRVFWNSEYSPSIPNLLSSGLFVFWKKGALEMQIASQALGLSMMMFSGKRLCTILVNRLGG